MFSALLKRVVWPGLVSIPLPTLGLVAVPLPTLDLVAVPLPTLGLVAVLLPTLDMLTSLPMQRELLRTRWEVAIWIRKLNMWQTILATSRKLCLKMVVVLLSVLGHRKTVIHWISTAGGGWHGILHSLGHVKLI